jgi:hypothetical protein
MPKRKKRKRKKNDIQTLLRKLKIEQHDFHRNQGVNSGTPEGLVAPAPLVAPVVVLWLQTR